eukprot:scaffold7343_cov230-Pinguiococcus_pyrenoidosus.AAC.1
MPFASNVPLTTSISSTTPGVELLSPSMTRRKPEKSAFGVPLISKESSVGSAPGGLGRNSLISCARTSTLDR